MKRYLLPLLAVLALSSCQTKQEVAPEQESDLCYTITLNDGVTTVTNIKDNTGDKLMPRTLFPDASDSIFAANNLEAGVPSSIR